MHANAPARMPAWVLAGVLAYAPLMLWVDARLAQPWPWQYVLGACTLAVLVATARLLPPDERRTAWTCVVVATGFELLGSQVWGGYRYRFGAVPAFVPFGHGLVYAFAAGCVATPWIRRFERHVVVTVFALALVWTLAGLTVLAARTGRLDVHGAIWLPLFACALRGPRGLLFAAMFVATSTIEICGTSFSNWLWAAKTPFFHVTSGNPPSAIAGGYAIIDGTTVQVAALAAGAAAWWGRRTAFISARIRQEVLMRFSYRLVALLLAVAMCAPAAATAAQHVADAREKAALMNAVAGLIHALRTRDAASVRSLYTAESTIVDEFSPYEWTGADAGKRYVSDLDKALVALKIADANVAPGAPSYLYVDGSRAYVIFPALFSGKIAGKTYSESGSFTLSLRKDAGAWKIAAQSWAKGPERFNPY